MRKCFVIATLILLTVPLSAQIKHGLRDENARHVVPRGFVVITHGSSSQPLLDSDDYARMVRMGANFQVVRLEIGFNSSPASRPNEDYLKRLDSFVRLGKNVGIKTVFKMTVYGARGFSWEKFWLNKNNEHQRYIDAWKVIWNRYKDEPFVYGYDLVNEPRKLTMDITYDDLTSKYLIPLYRVLIDEHNNISPSKQCIFQQIFMNKGEGINGIQYAEIKTPINRKNVILSPHIYLDKIEHIEPMMQRLLKEADLLNAPIFVGEWGFPTFDKTDSGFTEQLRYQELYAATADSFDRYGFGTIKAWFSGTWRKQHFLSGGPSTWAIFSDLKKIGTVERKYITDIIARPYPQTVAGDIQSFKFDHATRTLDVSLKADNSKGVSRIFIGADRHYPDGFSVRCDNLGLCYNPLKNTGLEVFKDDKNSNPSDFIWDSSRQQLIILRWPVDQTTIQIKIAPGINND